MGNVTRKCIRCMYPVATEVFNSLTLCKDCYKLTIKEDYHDKLEDLVLIIELATLKGIELPLSNLVTALALEIGQI